MQQPLSPMLEEFLEISLPMTVKIVNLLVCKSLEMVTSMVMVLKLFAVGVLQAQPTAHQPQPDMIIQFLPTHSTCQKGPQLQALPSPTLVKMDFCQTVDFQQLMPLHQSLQAPMPHLLPQPMLHPLPQVMHHPQLMPRPQHMPHPLHQAMLQLLPQVILLPLQQAMIIPSLPTHFSTQKKMPMITFNLLLQPPLPDLFSSQPLLPPPTHPLQEPLSIPPPQLPLLINQLKILDMFTQFQPTHLISQTTQENQIVCQHSNQHLNPSTNHLPNPSTNQPHNPSTNHLLSQSTKHLLDPLTLQQQEHLSTHPPLLKLSM